MNYLVAKRIARFAIASIALTMASSAYAQHIRRITTFATGTAVNATGPDSITLSRNSVWVSYTNGVDSTGLSGSSTIVQYNLHGEVRHTYSIAGSVDGLKVDSRSGRVWALQNQDGKFHSERDQSENAHRLRPNSLRGQIGYARLRRCRFPR
jgi:hypothetical protein